MDTLNDVAEQAFDVDNSSPEVEVKEPVTQEQPQGQVETKPQVEEDTFTKLNPNDLPEELKPYYKSLLKDYTQKRQTESARVKELEKKLAELGQTQQGYRQQPQEQSGLPEDPREIARKVFIEEQENLYDKQVQTEFTQLDDRLNEADPLSYDKMLDTAIRSHLTDELESYIESNGSKLGFDWKTTAKNFIGEWDSYVNNLNKRFIEKQNKLVKEKEVATKKTTPNVSSGDAAKAGRMSLEQAAISAFN